MSKEIKNKSVGVLSIIGLCWSEVLFINLAGKVRVFLIHEVHNQNEKVVQS